MCVRRCVLSSRFASLHGSLQSSILVSTFVSGPALAVCTLPCAFDPSLTSDCGNLRRSGCLEMNCNSRPCFLSKNSQSIASSFQDFSSARSSFLLPHEIRQTTCPSCLLLSSAAATSQLSLCSGIRVGSCSQSTRFRKCVLSSFFELIHLPARLRTLKRPILHFFRSSCIDAPVLLAPVSLLRLLLHNLHQTFVSGAISGLWSLHSSMWTAAICALWIMNLLCTYSIIICCGGSLSLLLLCLLVSCHVASRLFPLVLARQLPCCLPVFSEKIPAFTSDQPR